MSGNGSAPTSPDYVWLHGPPGPALTCTIHRTAHGVTRVSVADELDLATAGELEHALRRASADAELVVLGVGALKFMGASGVHVILAPHRRAPETGARLAVVRCSAHVERLFELVGVERELNLLDQTPARAASVRMLRVHLGMTDARPRVPRFSQ